MKTSMRACRFALPLVVAFFAGANVASADTFQYDGYSVTNEQTIQILTPNNIYGGMGQIVLHGTGVDAGNTLTAWCIDVYSYLFNSGTYTIGTLTNTTNLIPPPNNLSSTVVNEIGSLVYHGDSLISGAISGGVTDTSAAIQLAIWMVEYGNGFTYSHVSQAVTDLANTYIGYLTGSWSGTYDVTLYSEGTNSNFTQNNQNLVFAVVGHGGPNFPTPLPSTWTMLIAGFVGLGFLAYRGTKKNTAAFVTA